MVRGRVRAFDLRIRTTLERRKAGGSEAVLTEALLAIGAVARSTLVRDRREIVDRE
jgi:hypothetical protein